MDTGVHARLDQIERKLDTVIALLRPVHSHAAWVDDLRSRLHSVGIMRNTPRLEQHEAP